MERQPFWMFDSSQREKYATGRRQLVINWWLGLVWDNMSMCVYIKNIYIYTYALFFIGCPWAGKSTSTRNGGACPDMFPSCWSTPTLTLLYTSFFRVCLKWGYTPQVKKTSCRKIIVNWLVVWLPFSIFPYIGNSNPN